MSDSSRRTLIVTSCEEKASGTGKKGEWHLYEVAATTADGEPIDQEFRSFELLAITGQPAEFEVTPYDKDGKRTYTLSRPGSNPGQRLGPKVDELREKVEELMARLEAAEARIAGLESGGSAPADEEDIPF
jgi:hypothetical protein